MFGELVQYIAASEERKVRQKKKKKCDKSRIIKQYILHFHYCILFTVITCNAMGNYGCIQFCHLISRDVMCRKKKGYKLVCSIRGGNDG